MPNINVLYYNALLDLCDVAGDYVRLRALLIDIREGEPTSPDSIKTLAKYYDGDVNVLMNVFKQKRLAANEAWHVLKELMLHEDCWEEEASVVFFQQITKKTEFCDFRAKVRDWARAELRKEKKTAGSSTFLSMKDLIYKYERLLLKRRDKK